MNNYKIHRSYRKFIPGVSIIMVFIFINMIIGCHFYQRISSPVNPAALEQVQDAYRFVVLHQGTYTWHLYHITLNNEKNEMNGTIDPLPANYHSPELQPGVQRYYPNEGFPANEVHIYISEYLELENHAIIIPYSSISKISVFKKASGATVTSYLFPIFGVPAAVASIFFLIVLLTKSSCPFIYISDGNGYKFMGELYGGAIYKSLERDDYMPLPGFIPSNGEYQLKISNELLERQYTDIAELIVVQHPAHAQVLLDKHGVAQSILNPESPASAVSGNGTDLKSTVLATDSRIFSFNDDDKNENNMNGLTLCFKKPDQAKMGKLILNAKNSLWFDYTFGKFNELFGDYYNAYAKKQKDADPLEKIKMSLAQGIPLSAYVETDKGWEFIDYIDPVGPLATRDHVIAVDLSKVNGEEVKIKLECGFMFWEIDYAAMDFSENIPVELSHISPSMAIDEKGNGKVSLLTSSDKKYLFQPQPGNEVRVKYPAPSTKGDLKQSVFLHTRGYYEYIRDYKGTPDFEYLKSFRNQGALSRFSKQLYIDFIHSKDLSNIILN